MAFWRKALVAMKVYPHKCLAANVNHKDDFGYQPVDIAYWHGEFRMGVYTKESQRMVKYLEKHGGKSSFNK